MTQAPSFSPRGAAAMSSSFVLPSCGNTRTTWVEGFSFPLKILGLFPSPTLSWREILVSSLCPCVYPLQNSGEAIVLPVNTVLTGGHHECWKPISSPGDLSKRPATLPVGENVWPPGITGLPSITSPGGWK